MRNFVGYIAGALSIFAVSSLMVIATASAQLISAAEAEIDVLDCASIKATRQGVVLDSASFQGIKDAMIVLVHERGCGVVVAHSQSHNGYYQANLNYAGRYVVTVVHPEYTHFSSGQGFLVVGGSGTGTANFFLNLRE